MFNLLVEKVKTASSTINSGNKTLFTFMISQREHVSKQLILQFLTPY